VLEQIAVPKEELEAYYRDHRESFKVPPRVLLEHLLYKSREKARQAQKRLLKGETFTGLAKSKTKDPDLLYAERDWFTPDLLTREVVATAFQLPAGGVSYVIASSSGYHVLRAEAVEPSSYRQFDSVRDEILNRLRQQKAAGLYQQMIKETLSKENVRVSVDFQKEE
jgi:peptidyl-prolyl cis-trans isomerase D